MDFKVSCGPVLPAVATQAADELEKILGEIVNGHRKPGKVPMEPMITLIQFARDHGKDAEDAKRYRWLRTNYPGFTHDMLTGELPESPAEIDDSWRPELDQRIDAAIAASTKGGEA